MVEQWLALLHHSKKVPGPVLLGFLPRSKNVHFEDEQIG